jgi:peroxiredoxin
MGKKLKAGEKFPALSLNNIHGAPVEIPDLGGRWTHLQFRRFAGCPVCNLHLQPFIKCHGELERGGIREVVLFHSGNEELLAYQGRFPFDVIGDPEKDLYRRFGVETSIWAVLDPRGWGAAVRSNVVKDNPTAGRDKKHGIFGLPADFIIAPDATITAAHYGTYGYDQWEFDEVVQKVRAGRALFERRVA